ncbi:MAG: Crp/Fnr family transcriptional regulator [Polaromonas sp.]|nr:Crp/Fnr family transcriptional regulator [Polaromonas sp.]
MPETEAPPLLSDHLGAIPWLAALKHQERDWVTGELRLSAVQPGDTICSMGALPTHWIGVTSGLVKMSATASNGRAVTFAGFPAGGWFGEGTILKSQAYRYEIQALQPSTIARLPVPAFRRLVDESLQFNRFLMMQFNERLGQFIAWKAAEQTLTLDERLAQALATLFDPVLFSTVGDVLKISQQELGYPVGTSRQQINELMPLLRAAGAVTSEYGGVRLLDIQKLRCYRGEQV